MTTVAGFASGFASGLGRASMQAAVLVLLVLAVQRMFKGRLSPGWRCALWAIPALRLLLPVTVSSGVSIFNLAPKWQHHPAAGLEVVAPSGSPRIDMRRHFGHNVVVKDYEAPVPAMEDDERVFDPPSEALVQRREGIDPRELKNTMPAGETPVASPVATPPVIKAERRAIAWAPLLFSVWLAGVAVLMGRVFMTSRKLRREFGNARVINKSPVLDLLAGCADELGVKSRVRLVESGLVSSPVLYGFWRPRLVLPSGFVESLSWKELRFVFLHELAHVRRRDIFQNWIGTLLQIAHWFNPLVWFAFARWRADRELACDAVALETAGEEEKQEYGRTILRMLEASPSVCGAPAMVGIMENKQELKERISMIASFRRSKRWSTLALFLIGGLGLAGLTDARRLVHAAAQKNLQGTPPLIEELPAPGPKPTNGAAVKVIVVNEAGEPLKGAEVKAPHQASFFAGYGNGPTWLTDEKGIAEIRLGEVSGDRMRMMQWFTMSVRHPDYAPQGRSWSVQQGDARANVPGEIKVVLKKGVSIGGKVQDEDGKPLANVRIGISGTGYSYQNFQQREQGYGEYWSDARINPAAISDAEGKWIATNVPSELTQLNMMLMRPDGSLYSFATPMPNYPAEMAPPAVEMAKLLDKSQVTTLQNGPTLTGVVLDPEGKPLADVLVKEVHNRYQPAGGVQFKTDENGRFELRNRSRRQVMLIAMAEKFALLAKVVTIPPEGTNVTLQVPPLNPLRIKVTNEKNQPVKDATVLLDPIRSRGIAFMLQLKTDAAGSAIWTNAPAGGFALMAMGPTGAASSKIRVTEETPRDIALQFRSNPKAITLRGKAIDAETGAPVKLTAVRVRKEFGSAAAAEKVNDSKFSLSVAADRFEQGMYPSFRLQCEAEGYVTYVSDQRDFDEGDWEIEVKMKRGGNPGGTVLLSRGAPADGAEVYSGARERGWLFMNQPGKVGTHDGVRRITTNEKGEFDLKDPGFDSKVLITHEEGFAETSVEKLMERPQIKLQPWGRVEGTLMMGKKPVPHANVVLNGQNYANNTGWGFHYNAETDDAGKFTFEKVPPSKPILYRYFDRVPGPITETYQMPVDIKPGETTQVTYGGSGRVVLGQVEGNADWNNDVHLLVLKQPRKASANRPRHDEFFDPEEYNRLFGQYQQNDVQEQRRAARSYWLNFSPDGSFRIDDVPPGTYELRIKVTEPLKPGENRYGPVGPEKEIASLTREVVVPEAAASGEEEPVDLGLLELNWRSTHSTQPPVSFAAQSVDGKPFSLEKERGKFVLLNFWTLWSESSQEQMAEVSALHQQYKDDPRVAFYGVALGGEAGAVKNRIKSNGYSTEQLALTPKQLADLTESLSLERLPSAFLINPKGQVMARDLKGEGIEKTLQTALKRKEKKEAK